MNLLSLHLEQFRAFFEVDFRPDPEGTTAIVGPNGSGKSSLLEAIGYLGTQRSFRGSPREAMVREGEQRAVLRAELHRDRPLLVEAELVRDGPSRMKINRQAVRTRRDNATVVSVSIFSPEDADVIRAGPAKRRDVLDDALRILDRRAAVAIEEVDRAVRQRTALLQRSRGGSEHQADSTLDVWDERLSAAGAQLARARERLVWDLGPFVDAAYDDLGGPTAEKTHPGLGECSVSMTYRRSWNGDLLAALQGTRKEDLRRGQTTIGPHRDDVVITLRGRDARHQASQGEQRTLAIAVRLGVHHLITERLGEAPILLLDDAFSELDPERTRRLLEQLPTGQSLVTTATPLPKGVRVSEVVDVAKLRACVPKTTAWR